MAKKKVRVPRSRIGRAFARLVALPGEEPVFEEQKPVPVAGDVKPKLDLKELKAAVDAVNSASAQSRPAPDSVELDQKDIDAEYSEAFSSAVDVLDKHTDKWKKTGETGLYIEPRVTIKERVDKAVGKLKAERLKADERRWVDVENVPFRPKQFLILRSKISGLAQRFRKKQEPSIKEVFSEVVGRAEKMPKKSDDEIENIYKQLSR